MMPFFAALDQQGLDYKDLLTYVAIRSFNNVESNLCYPSCKTIGDRMGASKQFVMESIKRLEEAKYLEVTYSTKAHFSNRYHFPQIECFIRIAYEIFDYDLSTNEKSMLLCLKNYAWGLNNFSGDLHKIAKRFGLTYNVVYKQYRKLLTKGYLLESVRRYNKRTIKTTWFTDKCIWKFKSSLKKEPEEFKLIMT